MAKTLHEDPSCQLCNILKKYLLLNPNVEQYLKDDVPHLSILRQVIILIFLVIIDRPLTSTFVNSPKECSEMEKISKFILAEKNLKIIWCLFSIRTLFDKYKHCYIQYIDTLKQIGAASIFYNLT